MKSVWLLLLAACAVMAADVGGTVTGRVSDPSGAVVPRAQVALSRDGAEVAAHVLTDQSGRFVARNLAPAAYKLSVEAPGFALFLQSGVEVLSGQTAGVEVTLALPRLQQQVVVSAKTPLGEGAFATPPENSREILEIQEVRESAAKDVGEAVASLEGVWSIRKGGIANDIVLRGFQQGNLDVLIDGVRVSGACPNHMDPSAFHVDFAEIETVQVTKGPFDIRNQGSLGGTVNVITKSASNGFRATPNMAAGSFGFYNPSLQASYSNGRFYGLGGYSYRRSAPYADGSGRRFTDHANYNSLGRAGKAFDINTGWMKSGFRIGPNQEFDVAYTRQSGGLTLYPYLLMDAMYDNADRLSADWTVRDPGGLVRQVSAKAYFTRVKHWMTDELRTSSAGAARAYGMATFASTKALGGRLEVELPNTIVGFETYSRYWNAVNTMRMLGMYSDQPSVPDVRMRVGGIYAEHRRTAGRLSLTAGARLDAAASEANSSSLNTDIFWAYQGTRSTSATDIAASGTIWLTYALTPGLEVFGGVGSTSRLPDPQERYFALKRSGSDWVGNPSLQPSRNNEIDAGINLRNGRFSVRPTVFYSRLNDFIAVYGQPIRNPSMGIMNSSARSYQNVGARIYGGEVSYSAGFGRSVLLAGGASYTRGIQYASPEAKTPRGNIPEMPPLKSRASLRYGTRLFFAEVEGIGVAPQSHVNAALREQRTAGYGLMGLKAGVHHRRLNLVFGVDNLLNRLYFDSLSYQRDPFRNGVRVPSPGRTLYANMSVTFE
jgi:iron complex outermembrane receptor protein